MRSTSAAALFAGLLIALLPQASALAQEKKDDKKDAPSVIVASPIVLPRGKMSTVKLRGMKLAEATDVRVADSSGKGAAEIKIKSKGTADLPPKVEAKDGGDTQVEIELTPPEKGEGDVLSLVVVTPAGETRPYALRLASPNELIAEVESNGGFRQSQAIAPGAKGLVIQGSIQEPNDVDVFRLTGKSGQQLVAEVFASRHGGLLDSTLTLYDEHGRIVASVDDGDAGRDALLKVKFPTDGTYYLALVDALERGGATHSYALNVKIQSD